MVIELPDDTPPTFNGYLNFVYTDGLFDDDSATHDDGKHDVKAEQCHLVDIHILADKLGDIRTANRASDKLRTHCASSTSSLKLEAAIQILQTTNPSSPLRSLTTDWYVHDADLEHIDELLASEEVPDTFVREIYREKAMFVRLTVNRDRRFSEVFDLDFIFRQEQCRYHMHDETHPTCGPGYTAVE